MSKEYPKFKRFGRYILVRDKTGTHYYYGLLTWLKHRKDKS